MKRDEVLDAAKHLINGPRAKDYGDAYENHARIADGWNLILNEDSWIDKAGYTGLGAEFVEKDKRPVDKIIEEVKSNGKFTNGYVRSFE